MFGSTRSFLITNPLIVRSTSKRSSRTLTGAQSSGVCIGVLRSKSRRSFWSAPAESRSVGNGALDRLAPSHSPRQVAKAQQNLFSEGLMNILKFAIAFAALSIAAFLIGCQSTNENSNTTATTTASPPVKQELTVVSRPQAIEELMKQRGEQDQAKPTLKVVSPANNATISGSTVEVKLNLSGDLKGYMPHKDPATGKGNHIHVILDNQPYEAYYELGQPFELRNVAEGKQTLRVFPSRPWHESYKNDGAFQIVTFTVKGGGDTSKATTTNTGETMASPKGSPAAKPETASASPTPAREGKDMGKSNAGEVDAAKPLLTYSRPKGEYAGADADSIMIDFWLVKATVGADYRVRYTVDDGAPAFIDAWEPIWLTGWSAGKHTVKLDLVDKNGNVVENGGYKSTTRADTLE